MEEQPRATDRLWLAFAASSVASLLVLAVSPVKDYFREYRSHQDAYRRLLMERAGSARELQEARATGIGVRQVWIPEWNGRVDRCVSCHLGADDTRLAGAPAPYAPHPRVPHVPEDLPAFGCTSCHRGQGRATTAADAHGHAADWDAPLLPLGYTEASCGVCHEGATVPEAHLLSEGRRLVGELGCRGCHAIGGGDLWESAAPDLDGLAEKTSAEWLRAWLTDPRALRASTTMPDFHLPAEEVEALLAFLWRQPASAPLAGRPPDGDLRDGDFDRGKKLFRESRCISCHSVEGRGNGSAPELMGVGSKVSHRWLLAFLADPHAFQPRTTMPRYAFSHQDRLDLTQYMVEDLADPEAPEPGSGDRPSPRLAEAGEALFRRYGCGGCHRVGGAFGAAPAGPELTGIGSRPVSLLDFGDRADLPRRLPEWLAAKVQAPGSFRPGLKMPDFGLAPDQVRAIVTALLAETGERLPAAYKVEATRADYRPAGRFGALLREYRCLACHQVQGAGGDISTAPLTAEGSKVKPEWLKQYLLVPTAIRPLLTDRMIPLRMSEEQAGFLAQFVDNVYVDDDIPAEIFPDGVPAEQARRGRNLFHERYGCRACHQIEGTGGYYGPPLDDADGKLRSGWIAWWLQGPQRWRADVRCPDFGLDDADARDLAAYLVAAPAGGTGDRR